MDNSNIFYEYSGKRFPLPERLCFEPQDQLGAGETTQSPELQVAVFQMAASSAQPEARLEQLAAILPKLSEEGVDLVVCPELFLSGYEIGAEFDRLSETQDGPFARAVAALASKWRMAIVYGYPETAQGKRYNSAICVDREGRTLANYRKLNLNSEYERRYFSQGNGLTLFDVQGRRLALLICYDVEFPEMVRGCALAGAELVIVPTAAGDRWHFIAHNLVPTRAFENGLFVVYANYAGWRPDGRAYLGASCIVSPDGRDLARARQEETVLTARLDFREVAEARRRLGYLRDRRRFP